MHLAANMKEENEEKEEISCCLNQHIFESSGKWTSMGAQGESNGKEYQGTNAVEGGLEAHFSSGQNLKGKVGKRE